MVQRCQWAQTDPQLMVYHDQEWGVPEYDSQKLFELMTLELFQAGLSWLTVLKKRDAFRRDFANFNSTVVSGYDDDTVARLVQDAEIIRNRAKIEATIENAKLIQQLHREGESLADLVWNRTNGQPLNHFRTEIEDLDVQSFVNPYVKEFKKIGFKRMGPTTVYSFLQAAGVVNDHEISCFRYKQILNLDQNI